MLHLHYPYNRCCTLSQPLSISVQNQQRPRYTFLMKLRTDGVCHLQRSLSATKWAHHIWRGTEMLSVAAVEPCIPVSQQRSSNIRASFSLTVYFKCPCG